MTVGTDIRIVLFGPPAVGKGKVAKGLNALWPDARLFSIYKYFVQQIEAGTPYGRVVEPLLAKGGLLPDETVVDGVRHELDRGILSGGFVMDGLPVNARQAELLHEAFDDAGSPLTAAVHVAMAKPDVLRIVGARPVCGSCDNGRHPVEEDPDRPGHCATCGATLTRILSDNPYLEYRLQLFEDELPAITAFYQARGLLVEVDALQPADAVVADIKSAVEARRAAVRL